MNVIDKNRRFYEDKVAKMIRERFPQYESRIAVGIVGENLLDDTLFVCLRVCQGTIALLPFHKSRETVTVGRHEAVGGYLEVVDKRCYSNGGVKTDKHVYMVGHAVNAV